MKKKAIVLGGTHDHIGLIELLKSKNYFVVLVDYYENPPAKDAADKHIKESTLEKDKVLEIAKQESADLVITACIDQALLTMAYVCESLNLPCHISYETALKMTNKTHMKKIFMDNGIPTSRFMVFGEKDYDAKLTSKLKLPLVIKPADSNSSKGVTKVEDTRDLQQSFEKALDLSRAKKVVIEEYCEGEEFTVDVVLKNYEPKILMVSKIAKSRLNKNNFTIIQNTYPATSNTQTLDQISKIAKKLASAYQIKEGPLLIQLIYKNPGIKVVEFSARIGGGSKATFLKAMTGFDPIEYFICLLIDKPYTEEPQQNYKYGAITYIYAEPGVIQSFEGPDSLKEKGVVAEIFLYKTLGMKVHDSVSSNDRVAGFLVIDNDLEKLKSNINLANKQIRIIGANGTNIKKNGLF